MSIDARPSSNGRGSDAWYRPWTHITVDRRSPGYCRVSFDHPPANTITATTVAELTELVELIEQDQDLNVVVFDSAGPDFYLAHYDAEHDPAWLDLLVRLSRAPVVSIASIRGRVGGAGGDFVLACDLRFASRDTTLLGRLCGYVNRTLADDLLDDEVDRIASRLARLDRDAIARTKFYADRVTL